MIPTLSLAQAQAIVARFAALNPYAQDAVPGSILEIKEVSLGADGQPAPVSLLTISAKRYTFFREHGDGTVEIIEPSEHGLGHLLDPYQEAFSDRDEEAPTRRWIRDVWMRTVRQELRLPVAPLAFGDLPAVTRVSVSTPHVMRSLSGSGALIQPATFLLSATIAPFGHPAGADPARFHLVAPFTSDPTRWLDGPWRDVHSGKEYRATTDKEDLDPDCARIKTYADVVREFAQHPEHKSADEAGIACTRSTRGLLHRRRLRAGRIDHIGKESNKLEDVQRGAVHNWEEVQTVIADPAYDQWEKVIRPRVMKMSTSTIATLANIGLRAARNLKAGISRPSSRTAFAFSQRLADANARDED